MFASTRSDAAHARSPTATRRTRRALADAVTLRSEQRDVLAFGERQVSARHRRRKTGVHAASVTEPPIPDGDDTPASADAASVFTPRAIAARNRTRSSRHATVGAPPWRSRGAGRRQRRGQVDAREAAPAFLRPRHRRAHHYTLNPEEPEIRKAQDKRAEARRDWAEDTIDKEDWLDIKQRTETRIAKARKEYDKLTGSAAVFGNIPASDMVRDAWEDWNTDRRRAAVKSVLNRVIVSPHAGRKGGPNLTPELKLQFLRDRTEFDWRF